MEPTISVREMQQPDIDRVASYWLNADQEHLQRIGVDVNKIPSRKELTRWLQAQLDTPIEQRNAFYMIWEVDGEAVGHSNTNPTKYGEEAYMHLHIWKGNLRKSGLGTELLKMTLPHYFDKLRLKKLYCQPYALNPAPNKTLEKVGFQFVKEYVTIPGWLNFEQPVCLWEMSASSTTR